MTFEEAFVVLQQMLDERKQAGDPITRKEYQAIAMLLAALRGQP